MDFVAQRLPDGRWIRVLTVVDQFTRECLTLHADTALSGNSAAHAFGLVSDAMKQQLHTACLIENQNTKPD
jgi:hypothetical protein